MKLILPTATAGVPDGFWHKVTDMPHFNFERARALASAAGIGSTFPDRSS